MDSERRTTRSLSRDREAIEENERRALEELSRAMGQQLGGEDNTGGSVVGDEFVPPVPSNSPTPPPNPLPPVGSPIGSDQTPRPGENTGGRKNFGEEGTQGMMLAMMRLMADMNSEMAAKRRRREEWEQRRERETVGGIGEGISEGVRYALGRQTSATPSVVSESKGIKLPNPDLWRGDRHKLTAFLSECEVHFELNSHLFPDDTRKVFFMISHLRETPLLAVQPDLAKRPLPNYLTIYNQFVKYLKTNFSDPNEEGTAARFLNDLRRTGSASEYFSAFQRHVAILKWTDDGNLVDRAKKGLKSHLLDEIARHGRSFGTVKELLEFVIPLDNCLWRRKVEKDMEKKKETGVREVVVTDSQRVERKEEKRGEGRQTSAQPAVQVTITLTLVKTIPSNADKLRRQWPRPPPQLRETRKNEGKCTECGERGHWLKDCPVRAAKVKVGWLPPWGEKFGERGGGLGGNAVPLGQRRNLNAVTGEWEGEEEQGKDEDLLLHLLIPSTTKDQPKTDIFINGTKLTTLWDTGATCSYISPRAAAKIGVERRRYPVSVPVHMFDGSVSVAGPITEFVEVMFGLTKDTEGQSVCLDEQEELYQVVPEQYHSFIDVFNPRKGGEELPPSREYDLKFDLKEGASLKVAPLYSLGEDQRIKKVTVLDAYPLPLIGQITKELGKARYFSKLDLIGAYQLLRVKDGFEHLTAFRTQYGTFESLVVRDGLRNAPAVFQHFLNESFRELLGKGVVVYIDDTLIYGQTLEELRETTAKVFEVLRRSNLFVKASKCEFERDSVIFLGFIVSQSGVSSNPEYVDAVVSFPRPKNLRESRGFMGVVSYYCRFVPNFSRIAKPINDLTRKDVPFVWGVEQEEAFKELKDRMCGALVLAHFDPLLKTLLRTDVSFFGWGFIISQVNELGQEHPVAIESGAFQAAQLNYMEKETLTTAGRNNSSHGSFEADLLMEPKQLSPRQGRWVEELSNFRFKMVYRPGKQATLPDGLSRRADYHLAKGSTMVQESNLIQGLPKFDEVDQTTSGLQHLLRALQGTKELKDSDLIEPVDLVEGQKAEQEIEEEPRSVTELRRSLRSPLILRAGWSGKGFFTFDSQIYVPNYADARLEIMKARHESILAGHPGVAKTLELVMRDYVWTEAACISMDFIQELPNSQGYNSILVTERTNQSLELYLRIFTSYQHNDWSKLLGRASFTYNNTHHSAIDKTPFYANYGYHPRWAEEIKTSDVKVPAATMVVRDLTEIRKECKESRRLMRSTPKDIIGNTELRQTLQKVT
ncbi:hypothetical protein M231_07790 [Tremella mesenterica]|uniref:CCHC-type domain-containing protein n=1 Tax=Tremella mesenterica TaxID=5217 RepID=A0A4Q1BAD7_TREME|nr:hypothetical protein M231_07790 [Tremella mesenterica]